MRRAPWLLLATLTLGATFQSDASWARTQKTTPLTQEAPTVISGSDIGFRVEGHKGNTPVGTLVVRVDGRWIEPEFASGVRPLTAR
jgi:hypothetical protein